MTTKLKSIRAGHRSAVSRILRRFEERSETEDKPEEDELETILDTLKEKQDILKDLDKNILDSVQEEDIEQEILDTDEYKFNLETKIRKIQGEASYTIAGFALTHTNYNKAIELIHERFGQKHKIIQSYMQALLDIPAQKNTLTHLRSYYDRTETYIRGLESLGQAQDSYGSLLVPVILNKMPSEIRKNLTREHGSTDWFLGDLRRSIFKELAILESGNSKETGESPSATATFYTNTKSRKIWPKNNSTNSTQKSHTINCAYCKEPHYSSECTKYTDPNDRMTIVKKERLCFNCLGRHSVADCKSKSNCKKCKRRHHTSLCNKDHDKETASTSSTSSTCTVQTHNAEESETTVLYSSLGRDRPNVLLKTAIAPLNYRGQTIDTNILFDEGAQRSFITRQVADTLDIRPTGREAIALSGFGDTDKNSRVQQLDTATVKLQTIYGDHISVDVLIVPKIAAPLTTYIHTAKTMPYLQHLRLAHAVNKDASFEIGLLIGADQYWNIVEDENIRGEGPTAVRSKLGYLLSGPLKGTHSMNTNASMMNVIVSTKREEFDLEKFWKIETTGTENMDADFKFNREFQDVYEKTSIRYYDNRYFAKLPWKEDHPTLPLNRHIAYRRTVNVVNRLRKDPNMLTKYGEIIAEQQRRGFIEKVDDKIPQDRKVHYIPHHPVKKDSATTPIRIVYDCSCRETPDIPSLNDCLLNIPPNLNDIAAILLRFRLHKYAVTTDIEKAFLNVGLEEKDRDVTRFYWYSNPTDPTGQLVTYRFKSVLFGATCSPFILNAVLLKHLKDNVCTWTERLTNDLYVDNIISSFSEENDLINYYNQTRPLFANAGFNLRSWASNSEILQEFARKDRVVDNDKIIKVLGLKWNAEKDTITFAKKDALGNKNKNVTKRDVLKQTSRIYDPLGILSPITVRNRMFLQELWKNGLDWDQSLSSEFTKQWTEIAQNTEKALETEIPRMYLQGEEDISNSTLHIFTDASAKAYGACAYFVTEKQSSLVMAKSRVAPLKQITIPKLELMGAVIGARLLDYIGKNIHFSTAFLWTDSQIVLQWMNTTKPLNVFTRNRVQEIKKLTEKYQWKYCPTNSNPADLLSRGVDFDKFADSDLWFKGPTWINEENLWPKWNGNETIILTNLEDTENTQTIEDNTDRNSINIAHISGIVDISRFDTYNKLLHVTAYVIRFIENCRTRQRTTSQLAVNEIDRSALMWIKDIQQNRYLDIYVDLERTGKSKHSLFKQLKLYLDEDKLVQAPPLPKDRLREAPPFTVTGVDFTGALKVRNKNGKDSKAYICLFTCASTRAVHLEIVTDLTEEQFILAFRRFSSRKSLPKIMLSDNATSYVASAKEIERLTSSPTLQATLNSQGTEWKFIPKRAPWYGGFWERLIGLTKNCIKKVLGRSYVSLDVLNTTVIEVEAILNDRPLTYISTDPIDEDPLTPSHLLYGRKIVSLPYPSNQHVDDNLVQTNFIQYNAR
ncbi:uncharacterized protein LOC134718141 [Mytilus trossulus]|uniref:uncharacterized protein LOC134718141 n=1 Tax=Mytilus trossulus TaxID=6551 RepID=UPI003006E7E0